VLIKEYEQLKKIVPLDEYIISLYDEENQIMRFPLVIDEGVEYDYDTQIPFNADSSTGKVILTGKSILQLLDENQYPSAKDAPGMMGNTNRPSASLIYVPLIINQKTNGVMSIQSYSFRAYNQDQLILVENIANQLSISIQNAQLFEEANRRAERERIVAEITSRIGTSVRTESILKTAAQELNHLLNGAEVLIKLGSDRK
jgi:transcriptional regulator with GAF, ATPase, and Fis domain